MVHPFSHSLFTPSLFHSEGYDLAPLRFSDLDSLYNAPIVIEADDFDSILDQVERDTTYLIITDHDSSTDRIILSSMMNSNPLDSGIPQDVKTPTRSTSWLYENPQSDHDHPAYEVWNAVENMLGEAGVESQNLIPMLPLEMSWSMASAPEVSGVRDMTPEMLNWSADLTLTSSNLESLDMEDSHMEDSDVMDFEMDVDTECAIAADNPLLQTELDSLGIIQPNPIATPTVTVDQPIKITSPLVIEL